MKGERVMKIVTILIDWVYAEMFENYVACEWSTTVLFITITSVNL